MTILETHFNVLIECDVCGAEVWLEELDGATPTDIEKALAEEGWGVRGWRQHHHVCDDCMEEYDENDGADEPRKPTAEG